MKTKSENSYLVSVFIHKFPFTEWLYLGWRRDGKTIDRQKEKVDKTVDKQKHENENSMESYDEKVDRSLDSQEDKIDTTE